MPHGLLDSDMQHITDALGQFEAIESAVLFGSRAKGSYKQGSDVDLAIKGDRVTHRTVAALADCLNEDKPLPYFFDVVHYETLEEPRLKAHIDIVIFQRLPYCPR
ncbi:nucleotidyltransferase family protein [Nodosilinea nodulosa]|uniref:nucleotidyltransferase family protein n=1 Tax=Nodosilinea nodulosa TaxID=416001 RepID=UPI0002FFF31E|nr:nucleotidyltransferase domain-containing protein [Nodosilinea nodulosa]